MIPPNLICPMCNSVGESLSRNFKVKASYFRCPKCKCIYATEMPSQDDLIDYYSKYYSERDLEIPMIVRHTLQKTVLSFEEFRTDINCICDIGFGAGILLKEAQKCGWLCAGTDYSPKAIAMGKENNWDVLQGDLGTNDLTGPYDVVTIIETLEHVRDPRILIYQAAMRLREGGLLYGTTPNSQSLNSRILQEEWSAIRYPEHPILLSKTALKIALKELGFSRISIRSKGFNPFDLLIKIKKSKTKDSSVHEYAIARISYGYRLNTTISKNSILRLAKFFINYILATANYGDTLEFKAHKK